MRFNIRRMEGTHKIGSIIKLTPSEIRGSQKHPYGIVLDNFGTFKNLGTAPVYSTVTEYHVLLLRLSRHWVLRRLQLLILKKAF
jgi:hypothetical protein